MSSPEKGPMGIKTVDSDIAGPAVCSVRPIWGGAISAQPSPGDARKRQGLPVGRHSVGSESAADGVHFAEGQPLRDDREWGSPIPARSTRNKPPTPSCRSSPRARMARARATVTVRSDASSVNSTGLAVNVMSVRRRHTENRRRQARSSLLAPSGSGTLY